MIRKITFKNFYSFGENEQTIDFTTNKKKSYDYYNSEKGDQITKIAGIFGGNASGKTNICKIFGFLKYFLIMSVKQKPGLDYKKFFDNDLDSKISIEFETNDKIFFYEAILNIDAVISEKLSYRNIQKGAHEKMVFDIKREKSGLLNENSLELGSELKGIDLDYLNTIRQDVSFIAHINSKQKISILSEVSDYFTKMSVNVTEYGDRISFEADVADDYEDKDIHQKTDDFIKKFDLGLEGFEIFREKTSLKDIKIDNINTRLILRLSKDGFENIKIKGVHSSNEGKKLLDYQHESWGTRVIFTLIVRILKGLKNGNVIVADELEAGIHPEALLKIIQYFIDEDENSRAQLIFSSHIIDAMNKLDANQIVLVDKNAIGESKVYRLDGVDGVRSEHNFRAKYMSGAYDAFPNITI